MPQPNAQEQYLLELTNRFRLDPASEFDRLVNSGDTNVENAIEFFGIDTSSTGVLADQWAALNPAQPLAWSSQLNASAANHNALMIEFDEQSHNLPNELGLVDRFHATGSDRYNRFGENIFAFGQSPFHTHAGFLIDWGFTPTGIQSPPGHRNSLINNEFNEAGFSIVPESNPSTEVGPFLTTQHLAKHATGSQSWLLGTAFRDTDGDDFYSIGEGLDDITVSISGADFSTVVETAPAGGYQALVPSGQYEVSFSNSDGKRLRLFREIDVAGDNVKQDLMLEEETGPTTGNDVLFGTDGNDTIDALAGDDTVTALKGEDTLIGGPGKDVLRGGADNDSLTGDAGNDRLYGQSENDRLDGGNGNDKLYGQAGLDTLFGGNGADRLNGGSENDTLNGGGGRDILVGGTGNDRLRGQSGDDILIGVEALPMRLPPLQPILNEEPEPMSNPEVIPVGPTLLTPGNEEVDRLLGGGGSDTFVLGDFSGSFYVGGGNADYAHIQDFTAGEDTIQLASRFDRFERELITLETLGSSTRIFATNGENRDLIGVVKGAVITDLNSFTFASTFQEVETL